MTANKSSCDCPQRPSSVSQRLLLALAERDGGWRCAYCRRELAPSNAWCSFSWLPGRWHDTCPEGTCPRSPCWHDGWHVLPDSLCRAVPDHVVPRSKGGGDGIANRVLACDRCNCRKGARLLADLPDDWWS